MYYDECNKRSSREERHYDEEIVDGKPRYRWYKLALNSVYMISGCDDNFDIDHRTFDDIDVWYDAAEWVAVNDADALVHIMGELIPPVTAIVKQKMLEGLTRLAHYKACDIVLQHLQSYPVSEDRTFKRYKTKAVEYINKNVISLLKANCQQLETFKAERRDKLFSEDVEMRKAFSVLLHIEFSLYDERLDKSLIYLEWMRQNAPEELKELFSISISLEIKEQVLKLFEKAELYRLYTFIDDCIALKPSSFYYDVQPYVRNPREILGKYIDMDDDE